MSAVKPVANSVAIDDTATQITDSRFQLITNTDSTLALVQLGANSSVISKTIPVRAASTLAIDIGVLAPEFSQDGNAETWISLESAPGANTVFRTPISNL